MERPLPNERWVGGASGNGSEVRGTLARNVEGFLKTRLLHAGGNLQENGKRKGRGVVR